MRERNAEQPQPANGGASTQDTRERMIRETELFTLDELKGRHREAIDTLAGLFPTRLFIDPLCDFGKVTEGGSFTGYQSFHPDRSRPDGRAARFIRSPLPSPIVAQRFAAG
jgi:hypothetical protein